MPIKDEDVARMLDAFVAPGAVLTVENGGYALAGVTDDLHTLFGLSSDEFLELLRDDLFALIFSADIENAKTSLSDTVKTGKCTDIHMRIKHATKDYIWLRLRGKRVTLYNEATVVIVTCDPDTDEQQVFDRLLNEDERIIYVSDAETYELLFANKAATTFWGRADFAGQKCYHFVRNIDAPCPWCTYSKMGDAQEITEEKYDSDMGVWLRIDVQRIRMFGRSAFIVYAQDTTEQHRKTERAAENETIIKQITTQVFYFIAIVDVDQRRIRFVDVRRNSDTPAPIKSSNYDEDFRFAIENKVAPDERAYYMKVSKLEYVINRLNETGSHSFSWTQLSDDPDVTFRMQLTCHWLDDAHTRIMMLMSDISESYVTQQAQMRDLREAKREADAANVAKTDFLGRVSHDMRTPLNGILGLTQLMLDDPDKKTVAADIEKLRLSGEYLLNLINDTLDVSKIESGKLTLKPRVCNGRKVVENALALLRPNIEQKSIDFRVHADNVSPDPLFIDVGRIEQLIMNIMGNAIKFTPDGGRIDVTLDTVVETSTEFVERVIVADTGIGISAEFLPKIFEPFSQEDHSTTTTYQGTGLGMTISKQLVELMGGEIGIESELGKGTTVTFTLHLPRATAEQVSTELADSDGENHRDRLRGRHLLLCEDNAINAEIATRFLAMVDCTVDVATNGAVGVGLFRENSETYDCILMDVRMPVMDGIEATKAIRALPTEKAKTIPIIAMTANAYDEDVENCLAAGMTNHLGKPVDRDDLYDAIAKACK